MGTFAYMMGEAHIPEESRDDFCNDVYKVLCSGGMMSFDTVSLYGKEIGLLKPPKKTGNNSFAVWYNYFEDDSWEDAGFDGEKFRVWSGKIGWKQFNWVVYAAGILEEQYSDTPCIAKTDGAQPSPDYAAGWLSHVLGRDFTLENRSPWNVYIQKRDYNIKYGYNDDEILPKDLFDDLQTGNNFDVKNLMQVLFAEGHVEHLNNPTLKNDCNKYEFELIERLNELKESADNEEDLIELLLQVLNGKPYPNALDWNVLIDLMMHLKAQEIVALISKVFHKSFWDLWPKVEGKAVNCEHGKFEYKAVPPVKTTEYLGIKDEDCLYFWKDNGEYDLGALDGWFADLKNRFDSMMQSGENITDGVDMLESVIRNLARANSIYCKIYAFSDMFYEFLANTGNRKYQVWWRIFCDLIEENCEAVKSFSEEARQTSWCFLTYKEKSNPARMVIKRYLALMANKELRAKVFDI